MKKTLLTILGASFLMGACAPVPKMLNDASKAKYIYEEYPMGFAAYANNKDKNPWVRYSESNDCLLYIDDQIIVDNECDKVADLVCYESENGGMIRCTVPEGLEKVRASAKLKRHWRKMGINFLINDYNTKEVKK